MTVGEKTGIYELSTIAKLWRHGRKRRVNQSNVRS